MNQYDLIVIGGGISGMTAAMEAAKNGVKNILIIEREKTLGGILNQCIHIGFGKKLLKTSVSGTEYINYIQKEIEKSNITVLLKTEVLDLSMDKIVTYVNSKDGVVEVKASAIILATGCREKYTGSIVIPTNSFTGIYTVGSAHKVINIDGYLPGKQSVIVANNKWALIVARRLIVEGGNVKALLIMKNDNFKFNDEDKDIIEGFDIPVIENSKLMSILGNERIEKVKIKHIESDQEEIIECDSLLLSVGYFPEIELGKKINIKIDDKTLGPEVNNYSTSVNGVYACGNLIYGIEALNEQDVNGIEAGKVVAEYIKKFIY